MQEAACEDAVAACVDVAGFLFNVVKEDIMCKKISAARGRWSEVLNGELEEDENPHNKLKCDQDTSDEQIEADNAKISTLETSISGESARVRLTRWRSTLLAESEISKFSDATAICEKQWAEY